MKAGEILRCPHCSERTAAKAKTVLSGWQVTGTVLVCPLCGGELGAPEAEVARNSSASSDKLAALLGADAPPVIRLEKTEEYGKFCRNCRHFITHVFESRCGLDDRVADPMGDCGDFEQRKEDEK